MEKSFSFAVRQKDVGFSMFINGKIAATHPHTNY